MAHEYCPLFNHRTKDDGGNTATRSCVMTQNWLPKNTKPLKDASPIKYAWPVAKFTRVRSLLRQTRRSKLWAAPALERSSSRFAVYTMCAGCVGGKKKQQIWAGFRAHGKWSASISDVIFVRGPFDCWHTVVVACAYCLSLRSYVRVCVSGAWSEPPYHIFCRDTTVTNQILLQDQCVYVCVLNAIRPCYPGCLPPLTRCFLTRGVI